MKPSRLRILAQLLLVFYLLGGHAAAHGLSWCLAEDDHSHLEQVSGQCVSPAVTSSCSEEASCDSVAFVNKGADSHEQRTECRHLPTTSPHQSSFTQRIDRANDNSVPSLDPSSGSTPLYLPASVTTLAPLRHATAHLPPLQALTALRTIVLSC